MRIQLLLIACVLGITAVSAAEPEGEYRLGVDDVVQVQVYGRTDLSGQATLDADGSLRLPLLGTVQAADRTTTELGRELSQRYGIIDSRVSEVIVSVVEYNSQIVTVVGEVRSPGRFGFRVLPDLWGLILVAGGATPTADMSHVQIVHKTREGGEGPAVTVDLSGGVEHIEPDSLPKLRPKDTVIVPSAALSNVPAPGGDSFQVLGSVRTPGSYRVSLARTVVEALAISGGPLPDADLSSVHLTRTTPSGLVAYELDMKDHLEHGEPVVDLALQAGDAILVPSKRTPGAWILDSATRLLPLVTLITSLVVLKRY